MSNATHTTDWSTSAHGGSAEPSSTELCALKKQLDEWGGAPSRLFRLQRVAATMSRAVGRKRFVAPTSIILFLLVVGILIAKA